MLLSSSLIVNAEGYRANIEQKAYLGDLGDSGIIPVLSNGYATNIKDKRTVSYVKEKLKNDVTVLDSDLNPMKDSDYVRTGCIIKYNGEDYTVIIKGDVSCDGVVDSLDYFILGNCQLDEIQLKAVSFDNEQTPTSVDYMLIKKYILGNYDFYSKPRTGKFQNGEYTYYEFADHIEIVSYNGNASVVNIPSQIDNTEVTVIRDKALFGSPNVTEIIIPDTVTTIGKEAFYCGKLKKIVFGKNVKYVSENIVIDYSIIEPGSEFVIVGDGVLLKYRGEKKAVEIPDTVKYIADYTFADSKVFNVKLSNNTEYIGNFAFQNCYSLSTVSFPEGIKYIGNGAFCNCYEIGYAILPDSVTEIGPSAFSECRNLRKARLSSSLTTIPDSLFYLCYNLTECNIPTGVTSIGIHAFYKANVEKINLPKGLKSIGREAFYENGEVTDLVLPRTLEEIGSKAFWYCNNLKNVTVPSTWYDFNLSNFLGTQWYNDERSKEFSIVGDGVLLFINNENSKEICEIPPGVKYISSGLNLNLGNTTKIIIPEGVLEIGNNSFNFSNDKSLEVVFPSTLKKIGDYSFGNCYLSNLVLPDSLEYIGASVFANTNCYDVKVPSKLKYLGYNSMVNVMINDQSGNDMSIIGDGVLFKYRGAQSKVSIPDGIKYIAPGAFENTGITSVIIPDSVTIIGVKAFSNCRVLKKVSFGSGIKRIEASAFSDCKSLDEVILPQGLEFIGNTAFGACAIKTITIPKTVKTVEWPAFGNCNNLTEFIIEKGVKSIDSGLFATCSSMSSVYIPAGTAITPKHYWGENCTIITELGSEAFYYAELENIPMIIK